MSDSTTPAVPMIYGTIRAVMRDIDAVAKNRKAEQQNYRYRGIDDIYNALHKSFGEHGLFVRPRYSDRTVSEITTQRGGKLLFCVLKASIDFVAMDGSFITVEMIGEAMDSGDKATNKAMSVALKYACMQLFMIPTEEEKDPEAAPPQTITGMTKATPSPGPDPALQSQVQRLVRARGITTATAYAEFCRGVIGKTRPETDADRRKLIAHLESANAAADAEPEEPPSDVE